MKKIRNIWSIKCTATDQDFAITKYTDNIVLNLTTLEVNIIIQTDVWKKQYQLNKFNIASKRNATLRKNNSYNKSKSEEKIYNLLLTKFNKSDIIRQYKSDLYPFACDFYIKSLDLYIEYNGHWTHGWYYDRCLGSFNKDNLEH